MSAKSILILISLVFNFFLLNRKNYAQNYNDSLTSYYLNAKSDSEQAILADKFMWHYYGYNPDSLLFYIRKTIKYSNAIKDKNLKWKLYKDIGVFYNVLGYSLNSLMYLRKALHIASQLRDTTKLTKTYMYLGRVYRNLKDYHKALNNFLNEYELFKNFKKADPVYKARNLYDLGMTYNLLGKKDSANIFYTKSLESYNRLEQRKIPFNAEKPAIIYMHFGKYRKAIKYFKKAMELDTTDYMKIIQYSNIAEAYLKLQDYSQAEKYIQKAINVKKFESYPQIAVFTYSLLHQVYYNLHDYHNAYSALKHYLDIYKSLTDLNYKRAVEDVALIYRFEEKIKLDSLRHTKELEIMDLQIKKQKQKEKLQSIIIFLSFVIVIVIAALLLILKKNLTVIKKQNKYIEAQNAELHRQKSEILYQRDLIKEKNIELEQLIDEIQKQKDVLQKQKEDMELINKELEQSITYASDIQKTLLPDLGEIMNYFSEVFILYKPMSKVSGDFYWWTFKGDEIIIAVADCTGHGIPGAFMSILGISLLKEIMEHGILQTDIILNELRINIINMLGQRGNQGELKDGMDLSIVRYNRKTHQIQYSGANNPIYIVHHKKVDDNENQKKNIDYSRIRILEEPDKAILYELIPDRMPVSIYIKMDSFTNINFQIEEGDVIYMFTDGFADQFGGPHNKKYSYKRFKRFLMSISHLPLEKQYNLLEKEFNNWKKDYQQIDDVTILGFKV